VKQNIELGSQIYSDFWGGYNDLSSLEYNHAAVNKTGIGAEHSAEMNRIEGL